LQGQTNIPILSHITKTERRKMKIKVKIKNVYGTERIYPLCNNAILFSTLTNTKTFDRNIISIIKKLGFEIENKQEAL
tara:strand:+ start:29 stop:262 length:234 start_codon:yes stop_codon:yes gene_type:complete